MKTFNFVRAGSKGFTFVEVLATLTFAAIVLPAVMRGISLASAAASESRRRTEASILAHNKMSELISEGIIDFASVSGDFAPEYEGYKWEAELSSWEGEALSQLVVEVLWKSRNREKSVSLSTLVYTGGQ
ncbi:MAG TPA: hypothetical protein PKN36_00730 [bacterium]|nr:hypothetical protein [bacterium]